MYNWAKLPAKAKSGTTINNNPSNEHHFICFSKAMEAVESHLNETVLHVVTKVSLSRSTYLRKCRVLLLAPT